MKPETSRNTFSIGRAIASFCLIGSLCVGSAAAQEAGYKTEVLIPGHGFHGIHGIAFDRDGVLYAGSVIGQQIYRVDPESGAFEIHVGAPLGMARDLLFAPDGTLLWSSFLTGTIHAKSPGGYVRTIATGLRGVSSLALDFDGKLFASQLLLGDALWEIDLMRRRAPLKVLEDVGGLSGFGFLRGNVLYGSLWNRGALIFIDMDGKEMRVRARGFSAPIAAVTDGKGRLWVPDAKSGSIYRMRIGQQRPEVFLRFKTAMADATFDPKGRLFISVTPDNGIYEIDTETGEARTVIESQIALPADLAMLPGEPTLYLADTYDVRSIDPARAEVSDIARFVESGIEYPGGIGVDEDYLLSTSWFGGTVQRLDRRTGKILHTYRGFSTPFDALPWAGGSFLVIELIEGNLFHVTGEGEDDRRLVSRGLAGPVSMARADDRSIYISASANGSILLTDIITGRRRIVAEDLDQPEGIAVAPGGEIIVAEVGRRRVVRIDPKTGARTVLAEDLPIGLDPPPGLPAVYVLTGVAVDDAGTVYVASDLEDAIYKISPIDRRAADAGGS